ncbi:hypothetical protein HN51_044095 [Arachis hypogaea]|uniref:uncharacterized protein LOC107614137 n=1 Tax=Arachis ipaensis TaxID=130454 RepID=UPI0007AF314C|nr:uncharacterized protein LOC107614137 [Arachis ipaensis]XP_025672661.1 protein RICE SALT SENSITIVE 3 isoform X1 [Arachis hypogaea]QHN96243.1 uncharacterized protein DS421_18g616790 [Arachis hypogaea]
MVGSGGGGGGTGERSKEAVGMMALHEALRTVCLNSDWTYSVFWTIRPRPRVRGGNGCKVGDDNGSLMLMWEDGFCRGRSASLVEDMDGGGEDPVRKAFSKMSIQLYNYGEGLMGKVASDKCHKWVFKEPTECEPNISNYWQSSFDALPPEWTDQFDSGIQTIAVIQAGHGLLQLGSCKIIPEDLHFVLRMRHTFESLGYQSGFYLSQLFSSTRNTSSSTSIPSKPSSIPIRPPAPLFNWPHRPSLPSSAASMLSSPNFAASRMGFPNKDSETHMFLMPHHHHHHQEHGARIEDMIGTNTTSGDHENDIKWPNGLSFFNALTGRTDEANKLLQEQALNISHQNPNSDSSSMQQNANPNEFLSLETGHPEGGSAAARKMDKFKRSFTLPARVVSSSSSTSMDQHQQQGNAVEYRNSDGAMFPDVMETFLE